MEISEKIDKFWDWFLFERVEQNILRKGIKKLCKKHELNNLLLQMYLNLQNKVMDRVNITGENKEEAINEEIYFSKSLLLGRIFELNLEFVQDMMKEFYHSANALTRQMIEIYHISALLSYKNDYCKTFLGKDNKHFPNFKEIRKILKNGSHMPKIMGITKDQFFDSFEADYSVYSGLFHPKKDSFVHNLWTCEKDCEGNWINTKPYTKNNSTKKEIVLLFPKRTPFHPDYLRRMIHVFYTYTGFALDDLDKLEGIINKS